MQTLCVRALSAMILLVGFLRSAPAAATEGVLSLEVGPEYYGGEYFADIVPAFSLDAKFLSFEIDAPFRLRLNSALSNTRGFWLREDYDALSAAGRVLRRVDVTLGERTFVGHLGALSHQTLGRGTIVDDFGNSLMPDSQPVGLTARLAVGPVAVEALGANLLGLDVTALSVAIEPLSLWGAPNDRMHVALSAAVDWDAQAQVAQRLAVFGASGDAALVRTEPVKLAPYVDFNSTSRGGHGLHVGVLVDLKVDWLELSLRAEYRHTRGPYQPEYFDLAYPLERANALVEPVSLDVASLAKADIPYGTNDSWRAEVRARIGPLSLSVNVDDRGRDPFTGARVTDASAVAQVETDKLSVAAFAAARQFDWGHNPGRVLAFAEVRYRITPYLHAWTIGGRQYRLDGDGPREIWQVGGGLGGSIGF